VNSKNENEQLAEISRKLDVLIRLSALQLVQNSERQKDQIASLADAGFQPKQIAEILGTTSNTVSVSLNAIKKDRAPRDTKEKSKVQSPQGEASKESAEDAKETAKSSEP